MKKRLKRLVALALSVTMMFQCTPITAKGDTYDVNTEALYY